MPALPRSITHGNLNTVAMNSSPRLNKESILHSDRPFKVLGLQQIAIGAPNKKKLKAFWVDLLGLKFSHSYTSESENVDEDICEVGEGLLKVEVDLMQPLDPNKKPRVDTPALNHVGFWVDNLPAAVEWLGAQGVRFTPGGIRPGASGYEVVFIHPKGNEQTPISAEGVLVELVQAPSDVIQAFATIEQALNS